MKTEPANTSKKPDDDHTLLRLDGQSYYVVTRAIRTQCGMTAIARLPRLGKKAPRCYEYLGRTLALLEQMACCAWGCPGTDEGHVPHRLIGRGVSNGNTGIELALTGQYDEALTTARSVGELANLLWLFCIDRQAMAHWQSLESRGRWTKYRPAAVRRKIRKLAQPLLVEEGDYHLLSEHAVHVTPTTSPNTVGFDHRPSLGGHYREDAFILCINEIAWAAGVLCIPSVKLLGPAKDERMVLKTAQRLLTNVGGVRVTRVTEYMNVSGRRTA